MFKDIKIKTLIIAALGLLAALVVVVGGMGIYNGRHAVSLMRDVSVQDRAADATIAKIRYGMETRRTQVLLALQHNPGLEQSKLHDHPVANHLNIIADHAAKVDKLWSEYLAGIKSPEERALADEWFAKSGKLGADGIAKVVAEIKEEKWEDALPTLLKVINPAYNNGQVAAQALSDFLAKRSNANSDMVAANLAWTGGMMMAVLAVGVLFAAAIGGVLLRGIITPLHEAIDIANKVAKGDLSKEIEVGSKNEIGMLLQAMHDMADGLAAIVAEVRVDTEHVATAAGQIAAGNLDLSARTEQEASSLEETASTMEQITATVKRNAEHSSEANQLAKSASDVAVKGGEVVAQVVDTMGSISASANKIVDIISVIDGIAFQTNILALNAAVEAARAGEQGRGFAVVASEVRTLAQRSAAAAKEIKELIGDSSEKVDAGSRLVGQAGATMDEILQSITRVAQIMGEITTASNEQTSGIEQVNVAIAQMDEVTQRNAALVEQSAAAAQSMQEQAENLTRMVSVFKLGARGAIAGAVSAPVMRAPVAAPPRKAAVPAGKAVVASRAKRLVSGEPAVDEEWEQF
jgi:methyl-accepting chemotaxis protein